MSALLSTAADHLCMSCHIDAVKPAFQWSLPVSTGPYAPTDLLSTKQQSSKPQSLKLSAALSFVAG